MFKDITVQTTEVSSDTTGSPGPGGDTVSSAPGWVVISLLGLVAVIIVAMFLLTVYNMSAPRSTLKNFLGIKGAFARKRIAGSESLPAVGTSQLFSSRLISTLALSAQVNTRTTRTTLAIAGFSLLGLCTVGVLALNGTGVRDLRTQVMAGIVTLVATIAGFYFGQASRTVPDAETKAAEPVTASEAPSIAPDPDDRHRTFTIGVSTSYTPVVTGAPTPTLALLGTLPAGLTFDRVTGRIYGQASGPAGSYAIQIVATNGATPDAQLNVDLLVQ